MIRLSIAGCCDTYSATTNEQGYYNVQLVREGTYGRDPMRLALTTPGVIQGLKASNGVSPGEGFIGAGTREIQNEMSLDDMRFGRNSFDTATPNAGAKRVW